ncbi:glutaredoxin family protein [Erythrobacter insulae]|uniref:Methylamine utilization protein MauE n=1 Tax=Erythrobacter insulae TaxID=2584124 RepID=A0A547P6Y1_9SPHN|nr:glutaredoxin [Erythrobacter insulae]TRD09902.1 glutaredoxin family protein [Erythrobacter insulae]
MSNKPAKTAQLHRMVMDHHTCPYGIKAKYLLESRGFAVEDHHLTSRAETDAFKTEHDVQTTPQILIDGKRIGGYDALREHFGIAKKTNGKSYRPVIAVFAVALALSVSLSLGLLGSVGVRTIEWFVAFSMGMLAMLKLQDVEQFSSMFVGYDLLGKRLVPYAYAYPYLEALAAVLMAGRVLPWLSIPIAFIIGSIGAISVFYAVYIQKRDIKCACVGGSGDVPLGFISLSENLAMVGMAFWMLISLMG